MKLFVKLEELSNVLYNDAHAVDSAEMAHELIKTLNDNLKNTYTFIEKLDDAGVLDGNFYEEYKEIYNAYCAFDLYQLGDVINLLDALQIEIIKVD